MTMNEWGPRQNALDRTLMALAHPTRRAILRRLMKGEARVSELAGPFAISLNAVSKHILTLERAELVRRRKVWREHFVSYNPQPLEQAAKWIATQQAFWTARLETLDALLQAEDRNDNPLPRKRKDPRR